MKRGKNKKNERPGKLFEGVSVPEAEGVLLTKKRALELAKKVLGREEPPFQLL